MTVAYTYGLRLAIPLLVAASALSFPLAAGIQSPSAVPADVLKSRIFSADYVRMPDPKAHAVSARAATLVSSMAVAPNGRLWATWYCGISPAEDKNNYVVLATSEDDGKTSHEVFVADPDGPGLAR